MKIVIAPDSFKGTLRSDEVGEVIAAALRESLPDAELVVIPMADGGEGTTDAVVRATGARMIEVEVAGPLGRPVTARYGLLADGRAAVMEMASASGIELVPREQLNPMKATTFGTGELMRAALDAGVREIVLGIGGSATVDGGIGMAQALGYRVETAGGEECSRGGGSLAGIVAIDDRDVVPALAECRIRVACDVTNPLLGERGAAAVFGPQKGATPPMVALLEAGLANLAEVWVKGGFLESVDAPGDGGAGGLGAGLRAFCKAGMCSGAHLVAEVSGFDREIRDAHVLVTGEGRTDSQTAGGKLCSVLAGKARRAGARTILISGAVDGEQAGFDAVFPTLQDVVPFERVLRDARQNLAMTARSVGVVLAI